MSSKKELFKNASKIIEINPIYIVVLLINHKTEWII